MNFLWGKAIDFSARLGLSKQKSNFLIASEGAESGYEVKPLNGQKRLIFVLSTLGQKRKQPEFISLLKSYSLKSSRRLILSPRQFLLKIHNLLDLHQKPAVNFRQVENLLDGEAGAQGVADEEDAFGVGHAQLAADDVARQDVAVAIDFRADAPGFAEWWPCASTSEAKRGILVTT
jgi:hypothetical protein